MSGRTGPPDEFLVGVRECLGIVEEGSRMSVPSQAQFAGASGEYYVAAVLAYKRLHVGMVRQGGQSVDLLVSTADGSRSTTI